ncbi:MAG: hypothetical protein V4722_05915 [Bacteroidota bacterium]
MNYDYVITLKRPSYKAIDIISQLLLLLFLVSFGRYAAEVGFTKTILLQSIIPVGIIALWIYTGFRSRERDFIPYYRLPLIMAALGWFLIPIGWRWIGLGYGILGLAERLIKFPDEIGFTKDTVVRNTFPKRKYEWVDIENAIIRDNLFTLDLRNNKIIQKELDEPVSKELEAEFNQFCKEQLHFSLEAESKQ